MRAKLETVNLPMPPCFDCGVTLENGNLWKATEAEMKSKPDYDFRAYPLKSGEIVGWATVCGCCDIQRFKQEQQEKGIIHCSVPAVNRELAIDCFEDFLAERVEIETAVAWMIDEGYDMEVFS